jgi:hypothetical protein
MVHGNLISKRYINILGDYRVRSAHMLGYGAGYFFQDDNATCNRSDVVNQLTMASRPLWIGYHREPGLQSKYGHKLVN